MPFTHLLARTLYRWAVAHRWVLIVARSVFAIIGGYTMTVVGVVLVGWLMTTLFPDVGPGRGGVYYLIKDLLWISVVAAIPGLMSGYLTARLAKSAPLEHSFVVAMAMLILIIISYGPSQFFYDIAYCLYWLFFAPPEYRSSISIVLSEVHFTLFDIGVLIWTPGVIIGGHIWRFHVMMKHRTGGAQ